MRPLIYDTETTGFPDWHNPSGAPQQPHMVQLAAALVDGETRLPIADMNVIIRPDGWEIPGDVVKTHGFTTEYALNVGVPESVAMDMFLALWRVSTIRVAHNEQFDARIIRIATKRYSPEWVQDEWTAGEKLCTMRKSTDIVKLPKPSGKGGYKFPRLSEAYRHFTGKEMVDGHSAQGDVRGCMAVLWGLMDLEAEA